MCTKMEAMLKFSWNEHDTTPSTKVVLWYVMLIIKCSINDNIIYKTII
jgi:hypothetical protein